MYRQNTWNAKHARQQKETTIFADAFFSLSLVPKFISVHSYIFVLWTNYRQFTFIVPVNTFYLLHFITKRFFYFYFLDMVEMPGAASKNSICYNIPKRLLLYSCASFTNTSWPIHLFLNLCLGKRRLSLIILLKSSFFKYL